MPELNAAIFFFLFLPRTLVIKLTVKTEEHVNLDLQTKDIAVCVRLALLLLIVNKVFD